MATTTAPSSAPATSTKPDSYGAIVGFLASFLGFAGVAEKLGLSVGAIAAILGSLIVAATAFRAWWEGTQYQQGGSVVDPIGAVSGALLAGLGALAIAGKIPEQMLPPPDVMLSMVTAGFGAGASIRAAIRKRKAATIVDTTAVDKS